jgi:hypothetical protein
MHNFLEKETMFLWNRYWKTPVKSSKPAKKLEQPAQRKSSQAPKPKRVWKGKPKTPAPSPPETGGKSAN